MEGDMINYAGYSCSPAKCMVTIISQVVILHMLRLMMKMLFYYGSAGTPQWSDI